MLSYMTSDENSPALLALASHHYDVETPFISPPILFRKKKQ